METKYLSIDVETSSLEPCNGQILEFSCIIDELRQPYTGDNHFTRLVMPNHNVYGELGALAFNKELIDLLSKIDSNKPDDTWVFENDLLPTFLEWLPKETWTVAGKNFAAFDWRFLHYANSGNEPKLPFRYRCIDVGNLYWNYQTDGTKLPGLAECVTRAKLDLPVIKLHRAYEDASLVCQLVRKRLGL